MRGFWILLTLLFAGGAVAWWVGGSGEGAGDGARESAGQGTGVGAGDGAGEGADAPVVTETPRTAAPPPAPSAPSANGLDLGLHAAIPAASVLPGHIERTPSGGLRCDGRYDITGDGTREHPYQVSWELLTSAEDAYVPRLGLKQVPQRVALLQGAWVTVSGYVAFPLVATESDEVLLMLNQWDGCCIGVPPTPYDAIEVRLDHAIEIGKRHQIQYATITGVFRVDPYVADTWLVGLYLMENASISMDM